LGDRFVAIESTDGKERHKFTGLEAFSGRDRINSYAMQNKTVDSKKIVWRFVQAPEYVLVRDDRRRVTISPDRSSQFGTINIYTYLLLFQSFLVLCITLGIYLFARRSIGVTLLTLSGIGLSSSSIAVAAISTREVILEPTFSQVLTISTHSSIMLFSCALIALLWHVPSPINRFPFARFILLYGVLAVCNETFQIIEFPLHSYLFARLLLVPMGIVISIIQFFRTAKDPIKRAALTWLMMSVYGTMTMIILFDYVPRLTGLEALVNGLVINIALVLVFIGIAFGTLRYRLFDVQRIWWKAVAWIAGGFLVVLGDLLLVSQFQLEQSSALPLALIIAGFVYFPIRQWTLKHFVGSKDVKVSEHVPQLIKSFAGETQTDLYNGRFVGFLKNIFDADDMSVISDAQSDHIRIRDNGLVLSVPSIFGTGSFEIIGKDKGKRLFSQQDINAADAFLKLVQSLGDIRIQESAKRSTEREQIVRDLHDDVGGRLLSLIYRADNGKLADDARDTLTALKESLIVVEDTETIDFDSAWHQIVEDGRIRLEAAGYTLAQQSHKGTGVILSGREYVNVKRIVQEMVSNAIKHGFAGKVSLECSLLQEQRLSIKCTNQSKPDDKSNILNGRGLANIRQRTGELDGQVQISKKGNSSSDSYFEICVTFPL